MSDIDEKCLQRSDLVRDDDPIPGPRNPAAIHPPINVLYPLDNRINRVVERKQKWLFKDTNILCKNCVDLEQFRTEITQILQDALNGARRRQRNKVKHVVFNPQGANIPVSAPISEALQNALADIEARPDWLMALALPPSRNRIDFLELRVEHFIGLVGYHWLVQSDFPDGLNQMSVVRFFQEGHYKRKLKPTGQAGGNCV